MNWHREFDPPDSGLTKLRARLVEASAEEEREVRWLRGAALVLGVAIFALAWPLYPDKAPLFTPRVKADAAVEIPVGQPGVRFLVVEAQE